MGTPWITYIGAFTIYMYKGFKVSYAECRNHKQSGSVGYGVILLFVVVLYFSTSFDFLLFTSFTKEILL